MRSKEFLLVTLEDKDMKPIEKNKKKNTRLVFQTLFVCLLLMYSLVIQSVMIPVAFSANEPKETETENSPLVANENLPLDTKRQDDFTTETVRILDKRYERKAYRTRIVETFTISENTIAPFILQISNGDAFGSNKFLDAVVKINGVQVFGSGELNLQTSSLSKQVLLQRQNSIEIIFFSPRRAELRVLLTGILRLPIGPPPTITSVTPNSGIAGTTVTIFGNRLVPSSSTDNGRVMVTFAGDSGGRLTALISYAIPTEVRVTVPNGATTGLIELTNSYGRAVSGQPFAVEPTADFSLTVNPSAVNAVQRTTGTAIVSVTSTRAVFTQLATLSTNGLPADVTATFTPNQITGGSTSTLTLNLANANLSPGSYPFTIRGVADVDGNTITRTTSATLNIIAAGQTILIGRVLSTDKEPIVGATASLDGRSSPTDAAGNFILTDVTAGANRPVRVDGRTAQMPNRSYPDITEPATIIAGQANVLPFIFYLPPIDTQYEVPRVPGQITTVPNPRVDKLTMTIPANSDLRNRDGSPVTRVSITPLDIDRTPAPLPSTVSPDLVFTSQPGGAVVMNNVPIPVEYPNLSGANPGTVMNLWAFNHDTVQWYIYGQGTVNTDGTKIVPNAGVGLLDFSWHFPDPPTPPDDPPQCPNNSNGEGDDDRNNNENRMSCEEPAPPCTENSVDLASGLKLENDLDVSFVGERGGITIRRIYSTRKTVTCVTCPFGRGMTHNYDVRLSGTFTSGGAGRVIMPTESDGQLFTFNRNDNGTLVFTTTGRTHQLATELRKLPDGTFEYRYKQGSMLKFNTGGRLIAKVDNNGNQITFTYTGSNLTRITDATGRIVNLEYTNNRITRITDPLSRTYNYEYDTGGKLAVATNANGETKRYGYDTSNRITSVIDGRGNLMKQVTYNEQGRVTQQRFADGGVMNYSYTLSGERVTGASVTDSLGRIMTKRFNSRGYVTEQVDELGQRSVIERNLNNNLPVSTSGPCGCPETTRTFDARGNTLSRTDRFGRTTGYQYESTFNKVTQRTDRLNRVTTYTYDSRGNMTSVTYPVNSQTWTYTYDANGQRTTMTDPLGHITRMEYDAQGNMTARIDALNNRTTMEYDAVGRLMAVVDPLGRRTEMTYDGQNRLLSMKDPNNAVTTYTYDENGNQTGMTNADGRAWSRIYDIKNRLLSATDPLGRTTRYAYDSEDQLIRVITPSGRTVRYTYDARGYRTSMTDGEGGIVNFTYDHQGNLSTLSDQRGNTTTFTYDELYRVTNVRNPLGQLMTMAYDAVGNVTEKVDKLGRRTTYTYDGLNRPTQIVYADATVAYTYDAANRRTQIQDSQGGTMSWTYDDANRILSETTPAGTVAYTYNNASQVATMTAANRPPVTYGYDSAGRLSTITQSGETFTYGYDLLSRMTGLQRPNGVNTTYAYNEVNRLVRLTHQSGANPPIEDFQYTYNADDEIEVIRSLMSATILPTPKTASAADGANRIAQFGDNNYVYDAEGQITSKVNTDGLTQYTWDARGRLTQAQLSNGQTVSYGYDALGRRQSRTTGALTTTFLYEGADVVLDQSSDGTSANYLNGGGIDNKLRQTSAVGSLYFLQDHLRSTIGLTSSNGSIVETQRYEAFGDNAGSAFTRYGYTGRERDNTTGLIYYRARWYDPQQGRFVTEDPISFKGGNNFYSYANNKPIILSDPLGLKAYTCTTPVGDPLGGPLYPLIKHTHICVKDSTGEMKCGGQGPAEDVGWDLSKVVPGVQGTYQYNSNWCEPIETERETCLDNCLLNKINDPNRPPYCTYCSKGKNCNEWADDATDECQKRCATRPIPAPVPIPN